MNLECFTCIALLIYAHHSKQTGAVANYPFYKAEKSENYMIYNMGAWRVTDTLPASTSQSVSSGLINPVAIDF
jgi:hypothetical protein